MERFQIAREKARRNIQVADHMLTITYPMVKDPKLLLAVLENIFLAITNGMASVLYYERLFKKIPPFHDTFESKYNMFVAKIIPRYNIDKKILKIIAEVRDTILEHKKSPVEFARKDSFVICSDNYKMKKITIEELKKYISETKKFLEQMNSITRKNEEIFK
ncbi:hypothetical protein D6764_01435 [Candidatus Woesearchaeota archaeon]|nr:MAG: hypothetical protein D6764_01435 [Candidatus Woesearchaeota archaeon]